MNNKNWINELIKNSSDVSDYKEEQENIYKSRKNWANSTKRLAESMDIWKNIPDHIKFFIENAEKTGSFKKKDEIINTKVV